MPAGHRIAALEWFLLSILGGFAAAFFVRAEEFGRTAALFPRLVAVASLGFLALALGFQFFGKAKPAKKTPVEKAPDAVPWPSALAVQLGYVGLIVLIGFDIATLAYLLLAPLQMRYRRWKVLTPYAVLLTAAVVLSFTYLFNVRLPEGLLLASLKNHH